MSARVFHKPVTVGMTCRCDEKGTSIFCVFSPLPGRPFLHVRTMSTNHSSGSHCIGKRTNGVASRVAPSSECTRHRLVAFDSHQLGLLLALIELFAGCSPPALQVISLFNLPVCALLLSYVCTFEPNRGIIGKRERNNSRKTSFPDAKQLA